jgi:uncharacterized membrane protein HdeD (DUF308 family)
MKSSTSVDIEPNRIGGRSATAAGVIIAILGLLAVVFPLITGISVSILLGAVLVVGALVHAANAFSAGTLGNVLGQAVLAVLYGFAGIAFIANPVVGLATLTLLAIAFFLADGLVEIAWGLRSRGQPGTTWLLASGGVSLLLAGLLWLGFPSSAGWAIGVLLGVNLLVTGVSMILVGRGTDEPIAPDVPRGSQG